MAILAVVYIVPMIYVFRKRNVAATRARSPITTALCMFLLMCDSMFNTWIFGIDTNHNSHTLNNWDTRAHLKCLLGVWVTMCLMVPIELTMYLRIYRIKRVFEVYNKYLEQL